MTYEAIGTLMESLATALKCDYAYSNFKDNKTRNRFLIFYYDGSEDFYADGENYKNIENLTIEFYSNIKELETEKTIQTALKNSGLTYSKNETWIDSEKLFMTSYFTEVLINE